MRAVSLAGEGKLVATDLEDPQPGPGEMVLRVERAGVCGSDLRLAPTLPAGTVMGHEFVGRVERVGGDGTAFATGDRVCSIPAIGCGSCVACAAGDPVHCAQARLIGLGDQLGAFAERLVVGVRESLLVPEHVPVESAALIEPLAVAYKAFVAAGAKPGDRLAIVGAGPIGLAILLWAVAKGVHDVLVIDPVEDRRQRALEAGARCASGPGRDELRAATEDLLGGRPRVVIEAAGAPGTLTAALKLVDREGRVLVAGMHETDETIPTRSAFFRDLTFSFSSWYRREHFELTIEALASGQLDPSPLIGDVIRLDDLPTAFARARAGASGGKLLVRAA